MHCLNQPSVLFGSNEPRKIKPKVSNSAVSIDRVEIHYNIVISHFRQNRTLKKTYAKFPPRAIYAAVRRYLERSTGDPQDIASDFELLKDYSTIEGFLDALASEKTINKASNDYEMALTDLTQHSEMLGFKLADRHETIVSNKEYWYLKNIESKWNKHVFSLNGWPF